MSDKIVIHTDGACSGNPGPGGWAAVVLSEGHVKELGGPSPNTTNNRMELLAAIEALRSVAGRPGPIDVVTDSTYLISGITRWLSGWKRKGWTRIDGEAVVNRDLWEALDLLTVRPIHWIHVRGHQGHPGNGRCDEIAVAFSHGEMPTLYDGPISGYGIDLAASIGPGKPSKKRVRAKKDGWYMSLLHGKLEKHLTWAECQNRVIHQPALFKKVSTAEEEAQILKQWGL